MKPALGTGLRAVASTGFALLLPLLAALSGAAQAAPAAGTVIRNIAYVTYTVPAVAATPGLGGLAVPATTVTNQASNEVIAVVQQVAAFTLTSTQARFAPLGATVYFSHTLTNTGNGTDRFDLSTLATSASCVTCAPWVAAVTLYADTAPADGVPDSAAAITSTGPLAAGQSFTFVAALTVPAVAVAGQDKAVDIRAQGNAAAAAAGAYVATVQQVNVDTLRVTAAAVLAPVGKTFSVVAGPSPSAAPLTVTVTYANNTAAAATNVRISDSIGVASSSPVVFNTTGMRYLAGSARWSACGGGTTALTDTNADGYECGPAGTRIDFKVVYPLFPATSEARVEALIESVPAHTSGSLTFQVSVPAGVAAGIASTSNAARLDYFDGAASQTAATNQATYNVTVSNPAAVDLRIAKTISKPSSGNFTINNTGEYTLQVSNAGSQNSSGTITVTDTLPGGLEVTGITAAGWACNQTGTHTTGNATTGGVTVTCTTTAVIAAQAGATPGTATPIKLSVVPRVVAGVLTLPAAPGTITRTNTANVSGGGEPAGNAANNSECGGHGWPVGQCQRPGLAGCQPQPRLQRRRG